MKIECWINQEVDIVHKFEFEKLNEQKSQFATLWESQLESEPEKLKNQ